MTEPRDVPPATLPSVIQLEKLAVKPGEIVLVRLGRDHIADISPSGVENYMRVIAKHVKKLIADCGLTNQCIVAVDSIDIQAINPVDLLAVLSGDKEKDKG